MKKIIIFGTSEIARLAHYYFTNDSQFEIVAFTVDGEFMQMTTLLGLPVVPFEDVTSVYPPDTFDMHVALSYAKLNQLREKKFNDAKFKGYKLVSYICSKSVVWGSESIGENCFILESQTIQPDVVIGSNVMIWSGNHIGHGSNIGDHTYIASHVVISGNCSIGKRCFFGVNSAIKDFTKIGDDVFITMGALVSKDIESGAIVLGPQCEVYPQSDRRNRMIVKKYFNM